MSQKSPNKSNYDVVSVSRAGSEKRTSYAQEAFFINKQGKTYGQFVRVFADVFLKHEVSRKSYI